MKHTAKRHPYGYSYRGYYIERAAAGQWNIYDRAAAQILLMVPLEDDLIDEGHRSLTSAKKTIDEWKDAR